MFRKHAWQKTNPLCHASQETNQQAPHRGFGCTQPDLGINPTTAPSSLAAATSTTTTTAPSSSTVTASAVSSSTGTSAASSSTVTASASSSSTGTSAANEAPSSAAALESNLLRISIPQEPPQTNYSRPPPLKEPCLVSFEGRSTPPTPCCKKPVCNKCLDKWLSNRRVTCPHCRERLPNEMVLRNQEASHALLSDPDFQRWIRAVSLSFRCLCLTILGDKKFFWRKSRISVYITTTKPFRHNVLRAMS